MTWKAEELCGAHSMFWVILAFTSSGRLSLLLRHHQYTDSIYKPCFGSVSLPDNSVSPSEPHLDGSGHFQWVTFGWNIFQGLTHVFCLTFFTVCLAPQVASQGEDPQSGYFCLDCKPALPVQTHLNIESPNDHHFVLNIQQHTSWFCLDWFRKQTRTNLHAKYSTLSIQTKMCCWLFK